MPNRRLARLFHPGSHRTLIVPLDHGLASGPLAGIEDMPGLLATLGDAGTNAVVLNPGIAALCARVLEEKPSLGLIVHLSAGSGLASRSFKRAIVGSVEAALGLGADAVSVHLNVGSRDDLPQLAELAYTSTRCRTLGVPLLAMMYLANGSIELSRLAHAARMASELGADLVKLPYPGTDVHPIVRTTPCPVVFAGGARDATSDVLAIADGVMQGGAAGLAVGRHIFQHPRPGLIATVLARVLHGRLSMADARLMLASYTNPLQRAVAR